VAFPVEDVITAGNHIGRALTIHIAGTEARHQEPLIGGLTLTGAHNHRPPYLYRIVIRGRLGETLRSAFPALHAEASGADTVLTGPLEDRAALYGVLAEIEALGLELLEVRRLPPV
jgi:hypothetical protein